MNEFTKGPWEVKGYDTQLGGNWHKTYCIREAGDKFTSGISGGIASTIPTKPKEEQEANAHLIAASPDLFAVVEPLLEAYANMAQMLQTDFRFTGDQLTQQAEDALKKAKGGN